MQPGDEDVHRPDPDVLLAQVQTQEKRKARGKLRIYFGACAGVGKTYAMLVAADKMTAEGYKILLGIVDTHGRSETEILLQGLDILPAKTVEYHERTFNEFDIDAALKRHPQLILVDELAHSNVAGSRHPKRWQDVDELLDAGIDVFTTLNVQHLESLNDVIGGITGIRVAETVPDTLFDKADEVVLVDIPADELLARLKAGKIYQARQAEEAGHHFFRKGNLMALRELALRRTAERVGDDVNAYRVEQSINTLWKISSVLLACIGPDSAGEHVVRSAARLAGQLNAGWHAVYVETPKLQRLPALQRERILKILKLAEDLGATTAVLSGDNIARTIVDYARKQNFSQIILGRSRSTWFWRRSCLQKIAFRAPDFDLLEIGSLITQEKAAGQLPERAAAPDEQAVGRPGKNQRYWRYLWAALASTGTGIIALPLLSVFPLTNIALFFLVTVLLVAIKFGRGASVVATLAGIVTFNVLFITPQVSFAASSFEYLIMLAVGLIAGHLTANLRHQVNIASYRESRSRALYELARDLSGALQTEPIFVISRAFMQRVFHARAILLLPDDAGRLKLPPSGREADTAQLDPGIAQWAFDHAEPAGMGTDTLPASHFFYLPLVAPMSTRGLLAVLPENRHWLLVPEQRQQLDTFAALIALTLERIHYIQVAQNALVHMESGRLRNSLLDCLSRDLRAPLASLLHLSKSLVRSSTKLDLAQQTLVKNLRSAALRLYSQISNLLEMAQIQSGDLKLNRQWQVFTEIVLRALQLSKAKIVEHKVQTAIPDNLPLVHIDGVMIERVLCNLLENASNYTPAGTLIVLAVEVSGKFMSVNVYDSGPGLPQGQEEHIFEKFTRGEHESTRPGVGLGLAICRAIIEAHGGIIHAGHSPVGGASIIFSLPIGTPPGRQADKGPYFHVKK